MSAQIDVRLRVLQAILEDIPLALRLVIKVARILRVDRPCVVGQRVDLVVDDPELKRRWALLQALMLRDQTLDLGVHGRRTLLPDFVGDRRAGDFEHFVRRMAGVAGEPRLVPLGPDFPTLVGGEQNGF